MHMTLYPLSSGHLYITDKNSGDPQCICFREDMEENHFNFLSISLHDNPHKPGHRPPTQSEINMTLSYGGSDLYDVFP